MLPRVAQLAEERSALLVQYEADVLAGLLFVLQDAADVKVIRLGDFASVFHSIFFVGAVAVIGRYDFVSELYRPLCLVASRIR